MLMASTFASPLAQQVKQLVYNIQLSSSETLIPQYLAEMCGFPCG